jgi:hypothetical protein
MVARTQTSSHGGCRRTMPPRGKHHARRPTLTAPGRWNSTRSRRATPCRRGSRLPRPGLDRPSAVDCTETMAPRQGEGRYMQEARTRTTSRRLGLGRARIGRVTCRRDRPPATRKLHCASLSATLSWVDVGAASGTCTVTRTGKCAVRTLARALLPFGSPNLNRSLRKPRPAHPTTS